MITSKKRVLIAGISMLALAIIAVVVSTYAANNNKPVVNTKESAVSKSVDTKPSTPQSTDLPSVSAPSEPSATPAATPPAEESTSQPSQYVPTDQECAAAKKIVDFYMSRKDQDGNPVYPTPESVYDNQNISQARGGLLKTQYLACVAAGKI